jgi:hypothetical protein
MAVINLVIEAMGTTRSAFFTSSLSDVLASTTSPILDLTFRRDCEACIGEDFLGAAAEGVVVGEADVEAGVRATSPICAAKTIPAVLIRPEENGRTRITKASPAATMPFVMQISLCARR